MEYLIQTIARHWDLSPTHYWHLRILSSVLLGPLLGIGYLLFSTKRTRPRRRPAADAGTSLWVGSDGRLLTLPKR